MGPPRWSGPPGSRRPGTNLESSSDPRSRTVNGCVGFRLGSGPEIAVDVAAAWKTGRKYAPSPPRPARTKPRTTTHARCIRDSDAPPQATFEDCRKPVQARPGALVLR